MKEKIRVVHLIKDDKFFDSNALFYEKLENVENQFFLFTRRRNYSFKYIKSKEKVTIFSNFLNYIKAIRNNDVVIFYSFLSFDYLSLFLLPSNLIVIWWAWGYDIYDSLNGMSPLVQINLFKPLTNQYLERHQKKSLKKQVKNHLLGPIFNIIRHFGLPKIDFMIPCVSLDYELVKDQHPNFRAKLFPCGLNRYETKFLYKEKSGNILIGNSLTYTNNHLDIFERLYDIIPSDETKCILPINYGTAFNNGDDLIKLSHFKENQVIWLRTFMDKISYFKLINSVTHAVFGVIRQQALGNIYYCLRTGVKVYLYDESIVSKQLRRDGYIFFSIDTDLTAKSLLEPLSEEQALHNYNIWTQRYIGTSVSDIQKALFDAVV